MKKVFVAVLAVLLVLSAAGCGTVSMQSQTVANAKSGYGYGWEDAPASAATPVEAPAAVRDEAWEATDTAYNNEAYNNGECEPASAAPRPVKMVYRGDLSLETTTFDQAQADLDTLVTELGGYFEQKNVYNYGGGYRNGDMVVRVPTDKFEVFLTQAGNLCHITHMGQSAEDVSEHYYDVDARLTTARAKLERLRELLTRADNMSDIIVIESAIADTEYTIDNLSGTLRSYDSLVDYATVSVYLREVYQYSDTKGAPLTFGERLASAFGEGLRSIANFFRDLVLWLAYSWFWLLVLVGIVVLAVRIVRKKGIRIRRRKKAGAENKNDAE